MRKHEQARSRRAARRAQRKALKQRAERLAQKAVSARRLKEAREREATKRERQQALALSGALTVVSAPRAPLPYPHSMQRAVCLSVFFSDPWLPQYVDGPGQDELLTFAERFLLEPNPPTDAKK